MCSLPLKYVFLLWPLRSNRRHRIRLLGVASQYHKQIRIILHELRNILTDETISRDTARGRGCFPVGGGKILFSSTACRPALGPTQPRIQWLPTTLPPRVKRPGCDADHSPPSIAEVKNNNPPHVLMVPCLIS
jgi:hypothetical protein